MEIKIDDLYELETLKIIAANNKLTTEQYATNIVRGWIQNQIKGMYIAHVQEKSIADIKSKIGHLKIVQAAPAILKEDI